MTPNRKQVAHRLVDVAVACNVYVSAGGGGGTGPVLTKLLKEAQNDCKNLPSNKDPLFCSPSCLVVHAFTDAVYDRSSFHLAGHPVQVAEIASNIAIRSIQSLLPFKTDATDSDASKYEPGEPPQSRHPYVGIVDHISIMPLGDSMITTNGKSDEKINNAIKFDLDTNPTGWAARRIGESLSSSKSFDFPFSSNLEIHYYGNAHPEKTPLADIRRSQTNFFRSGGLVDQNYNDNNDGVVGSTIIGAPESFVENYNVRLKSLCTKKTARSLTRHIRERDGGLPWVEALTLPYSNQRWEVACNLLRPNVSSSKIIDMKIREWEEENRNLFSSSSPSLASEADKESDSVVETAYRVGTTEAQCLDVLIQHSSVKDRNIHDENVLKRFKQYLNE